MTASSNTGWTRWILQGHAAQDCFRRQQGGGGVMFWTLIVEDKVLGPFQVADGVKINSEGFVLGII